MSLSNNISSARRKMGFTQEQLAEKCGVSRQAVTKWECGESEPSIAKLVTLSQILQIDLTELITGKKSDDQKKRERSVLDYRNLSAMTGLLTMDYYPLDKTSRFLILENLFEVIETRYINSDGRIFEKYLLSNTTSEERLAYVRILMGERRFAKDILQEYVDGKCEIDSAFKKLIHKVREQQSIGLKIKDKKDESKVAEVYHEIHRNLRTLQNYDEFNEKKQNELTLELNCMMEKLCDDVPIQCFLRMFLSIIQTAWNTKNKELLKLLQECLGELQEFVWNNIEI